MKKNTIFAVILLLTIVVTGAWATMPTNLDFTTFLGANNFVSNSGLTTGVYKGSLVINAPMAASVAVYGLVYATATGYNLADADAAATMPVVGLCLETGTGTRLVLLRGVIRYDTWAWTVGGKLYCGLTGELTQTAPSLNPDVVQVVGYAIDADTIDFNPDSTIVTVP